MRHYLPRLLPVVLAAALQLMPMLRNIVGLEAQGLTPSGYAFILKIGVGALALLGFDAVSSATSVSIYPNTATFGQPYTGTITFISAYQNDVNAMTISNVCMDTPLELAPGLTAVYTSGYTAAVSGTPTTPGIYIVSIQAWTGSCNVGLITGPKTCTLTVLGTPPVWVTTPSNMVVQAGSSLVWSSAASGTPAPGFYWQQGTNPVPVATQPNLTNNAVQLTDAGLYAVSATNSAGSISTNAYLTVVVAPVNSWLYSGLPLTVTNYQPTGSTLHLSIFVTNVPAAKNQYQWSFNNSVIPGATSPSLSVSNVSTNKSGAYTVVFTSILTTTNGSVITTNVLANQGAVSDWQFGHPPTILTQPTNQASSAGGSVMFAVTASGDSLMGTNYQWYFNSAPLAGQTNASLTVNPVNAGNVGNYFVAVTNVYGAVSSSVVSLSSSNIPPLVIAPPTNQIVECGGNATFNVGAIGTAPLGYQWYLNGQPTSGATNASYTINGVTGAGNSFRVASVVTNYYGISSNSATLTVVDTTSPVITILGSNPTNIQAGTTYVDAGATGNDSCAGAVPVRINNSVNTAVPGTYLVTYTADDGNGNTNSATRTVLVVSPTAGPTAGLLQDGQDYPASGITPTNGRGPWSLAGGSGMTLYISIQPGDLSGATVPDILPLPNTVNPAAKLQVARASNTLRWYYRGLSNNVTSGPVYFSFLLNVTVNPTTTDEFMGSLLAGGASNQPAATDPLTFHARAGADGTHFDLGIERLNGTTSWTGDLADNTTYLVVLKYTFGGVNSLYVDPTPGGGEPVPTATANPDGVTAEPASIGTVLFFESSLAGGTSGTYQYDVMRADTNWATVTPAAGSVPASAPTVNLQPSNQPGILQLYWPISTTSFQVQTADSPLGPWTTVSLPITTNGANARLTVTATNLQQYFRLLGN